MRASEDNRKVIVFLQSYPDYLPSPVQVAHTTEAVKRKIMQDKPSTLSWFDGIFAALFVPVLMVLLSGDKMGIDQYFGIHRLAQWSSVSYPQFLLVFLMVAIPPLLLVILPLNNRR